ncbi:MAG: magnesium transporter [Novosphingobium sp. 28-62-57]|uniref:magnesium transporter n=1 Tax=unclassified Novosphingobium TaxID=2644732 RepID=UPI000BD9A7A2|nr:MULTISPECIES: magnesium transporter [unclassified Novosphingobium]OYW51071.1 MAG: magnesium transporter [Novosphingobium sp. 12-62-10]OYZ11108.1 MAG: magnesium transporter [Novosphingobium sp. 28-62-57]OZA35895.1 MAG: magnesium transporter [Novosphingobium sp. 17-62-9]
MQRDEDIIETLLPEAATDAPTAEPVRNAESLDEEYNTLRPGFVRKVVDALESGDDEKVYNLVEPLHPADIADLFELIDQQDRVFLARAISDLLSGEVIAELNDYVREYLVEELEPEEVAELAEQMETDDAVALIEDMDEEDQQAVLAEMEPEDRAAIESALSYPEETAGRLMSRDLIAVPEAMTVGDLIDYMRRDDKLPTEFWEVFIVDPKHHPIGTCSLSWILRAPRSVPLADVMKRDQTLIPVSMDQEEVALRFQKYALISAAVVDENGRLVGQITVDDIVHIIQEEASEDILRLSGAGDGDINEPILLTVRTRLTWLVVNLGTAMLAASVVGMFQGAIARFALLAVLMPIVSGMGGNAGTQTLAVVVRALATNQLTSSNTVRMILRELRIAATNGSALGLLVGSATAILFSNPLLGAVIGTAMVINNLVAGLAGILVPVTLDRLKVDPAVSSAVFVTMATDVMGFFSFLGLAVLSGLTG